MRCFLIEVVSMQEDNKSRRAEPDFSMTAEPRPSRHRAPSRNDDKPARSGGFLVSGALFLLLVGVAAGGYWQLTQLQQALKETRQELLQTRDHLSQVTGQVSKTGENITASDSNLRSQLKEVNSEIRKLWDVSNKRNRQWITENKDKITENAKRMNSAVQQLETVKKSAKQRQSQLEKELTETAQTLKAISAEQLVTNSEMTARVEALSGDMDGLKTATSAAVQEVQRVTQQMQGVVQTQDELSKKFSAYQRQVSIRLQQLENTLRELRNPKEGGLTIQ